MRTPEDRARFVGTALILFLLLVMFCGMLFWMYSVKLLTIPAGLAGLLGIDQDDRDSETSFDAGGLAGMISSERPEDGKMLSFSTDYANLRQAILDEPAVDGYRQEFAVSYSQSAVPTDIVLIRSGDKARVEVWQDAGTRSKLMIFDGTVYLLDDDTGESRSIPRAENVSPESMAGVPSVAKLLEEIEKYLPAVEETVETDAETTVESDDEPLAPLMMQNSENEIGECVIELRSTDAGNVYYVGFSDPDAGTREEYYLSLEYNVVLRDRKSVV